MKYLLVVVVFTCTLNFAQAKEVTEKLYPVIDGAIATAPYPGSWNQQYWSTVGRTANSRDGALDVYAATRSTRLGWMAIYRSFLTFDTANIPSTASVVSAELIVYPQYVLNGIDDSYAYMGVYPSYQESPTQVSFDDIDTCGDVVENPSAIAKRALADFTPDSPTSFLLDAPGVDWISSNNLVSICLRTGRDAENQEIVNNDQSYWRSSGLVIYGANQGISGFRPYLEITYTVPDPVDTVEEGVGVLEGFIDGLTDKVLKNSYTANFKNILDFFETGKYQAALNQLSALFKKVDTDAGQGQIEPEDLASVTAAVAVVQTGIEAAAEASQGKVPLITQVASPFPPESSDWAALAYANGTAADSCGTTIGQCGCALSSMSMLARSYGITEGMNGASNPRDLNAWLTQNSGYTPDGGVWWNKVLEYFGEKRGGVVYSNLALVGHNVTNTTTIDTFLAAEQPVVAFNNRLGHFFVLTSKNADGSYEVRDPFWYNTKRTDEVKNAANKVQSYYDGFNKTNLFAYNPQPKKVAKAIEIHLASPAELLLTDSAGRRVGYVSDTGHVVTEIPGSSYDQASVINTTGDATNPHAEKVLMVLLPGDDVYTLEVIGTGTGSYTLSVLTVGEDGAYEIAIQEGETTPSEVDGYIVDIENGNGELTTIIEHIRSLVLGGGDDYAWLVRRLDVLEDKVEKENLVAAEAQVATLLTQLAARELTDVELIAELESLKVALGE